MQELGPELYGPGLVSTFAHLAMTSTFLQGGVWARHGTGTSRSSPVRHATVAASYA